MTDHLRLHVREHGQGLDMLFVHGWLNDTTVWDGVIQALAPTFRCIAVDLRGHGDSPTASPGRYGRDEVLDDLRHVLDERVQGPVIVVGHSLGGYLALALAIEDPARVCGLGLVAAGPGFRNPDSREQWNESVVKTAAGRDIPPGQEAISMHVDAMVMDRLGEITAPVAVIVGEHDKRFLASADVFDKYLDVRLRAIVPDKGHMVHVKAPADVATALASVFGESLAD